jgi:hypothetical protein
MYLQPYEISKCTKSSVFDRLPAKGFKKAKTYSIILKQFFELC